MEMHQLITSIAAFSFLSSAVSMLTIKIIPPIFLWRNLNRCRLLLMTVFMVVGFSSLKNILFDEMMTRNGIIVSTLISAAIQSMLLYLTSITFLQPTVIKRQFVLINSLGIVLSSVQLLTTFFLFPQYIIYSALISVLIYVIFLVIYQVHFFRLYRDTIAKSDDITDEDTEVRYRWVKRFFISVTILGITAVIAPFCDVMIYDAWMLCAALFYVYIVVSFINYFSSLSAMVANISLASVTAVPDEPEDSMQIDDFSQQYAVLEKNLQRWVERHGYVENDLVSDTLAHQLGVNIIIFRSYFKEKKNTDFRQWRLKLRIEYACQIIRNHPDYSYDAVADLVGICDRSNFNKAFKRIMNITPREYSRRLRAENADAVTSITE